MSSYLSTIQLFPALLSARRRSLHLSAADLAAQARMTVDMVARLEHGFFLPSPSQATQLAVVLGLDPADLGGWAVEELLRHPEFLVEHLSQANA